MSLSFQALFRVLSVSAAAAFSAGLATPALPGAELVQGAVRSALTEPAPAQVARAESKEKAANSLAAARTTPSKKLSATELRQKAVAQAQQQARKSAPRRAQPRTAVVRATAYNSLSGQTDGSPYVTATGTRTRFGVIALSRDLLARFPYGTKVRLEDLSGRFTNLLADQVFVVEDTMHPRKRNTIDIWMSGRRQAMQWGARDVRIEAVN